MRKSLVMIGTTFIATAVLAGALAAQSAPAKGQAAPAKAPAAKATPAPSPSASPAAAKPTPTPAFAEQKDQVSYALGMNIAASLKQQPVELNPDVLAAGIKDGLAGKTKMTEDEARAVLMKVSAEIQAKQQEKAKQEQAEREKAGEVNKKEGEAFLAANKSKEGVVTLPSGLQYKIVTTGKGPKPTAADTVVCNYKGTLIDGKEFDSSYSRGEPASFRVGGVIKGWTEALQLMPVGSKWDLYIPADLAYGARGTPGGPIGPNATLLFEVELLSIKTPDAPAPADKK
jgi:FKBP-type peptidyl-prolyl cis-trans isomerase FklB